jgi:hypothetical protein
MAALWVLRSLRSRSRRTGSGRIEPSSSDGDEHSTLPDPARRPSQKGSNWAGFSSRVPVGGVRAALLFVTLLSLDRPFRGVAEIPVAAATSPSCLPFFLDEGEVSEAGFADDVLATMARDLNVMSTTAAA